MSFACPQCSKSWSLGIAASIELPPDSRSDEIALQIVECSSCKFAGIAIYEESRRGALDSESVNHIGYRASAKDVQALKKAIGRCPKPKNQRCRCATHRRLDTKDVGGRWNGLDKIELGQSFPMTL